MWTAAKLVIRDHPVVSPTPTRPFRDNAEFFCAAGFLRWAQCSTSQNAFVGAIHPYCVLCIPMPDYHACFAKPASTPTTRRRLPGIPQ